MQFRFGSYVLDKDRIELTGPDGTVHVERLPLDVLVHLIECSERVVHKDELIDAVWGGRIVSEATISSAIKQARRAVGDDGKTQAVIRTVHGRGFRFVAEVETGGAARTVATPLAPPGDLAPDRPASTAREHGQGEPGVAVLRFVHLGQDDRTGHLADAIPNELISGLSRTRWLRVIARGSSFRFDPGSVDPADVGAQLKVPYLINGTIETSGDRIAVSLELQSAVTAHLVWAERFERALSEIDRLRSEMVAAVIATLELKISDFEARLLRRLGRDELDAWSHFHLGLTRAYRFTEADNAQATAHFEAAVALDPDFARAHAGLSFTRWQNGFMYHAAERPEYQRLAMDAARRAADLSRDDPFVNFNLGRAHWLAGDIDTAEAWLSRAIEINPNYAQGCYSKGIVLLLAGQFDEALALTGTAMSLSPLDPFIDGMHSVRSVCLAGRGDYAKAAIAGETAMQVPGSHHIIAMVTAIAHELNENRERAVHWRDYARRGLPDLSADMFFRKFPFRDPAFRRTIAAALTRLGVP